MKRGLTTPEKILLITASFTFSKSLPKRLHHYQIFPNVYLQFLPDGKDLFFKVEEFNYLILYTK
ncbi:hypothetical protein OA84_00175 [Kaistella solincola]|uniref:Uncharacterized protein n=1 Tax=Kaistella solincola TaxID=510955 RepID=A0ABR4ZV00_9FLAO|nr:hypothetical protein OA84_00175 [Kaistella solincola]